jgi:hypothetical protein
MGKPHRKKIANNLRLGRPNQTLQLKHYQQFPSHSIRLEGVLLKVGHPCAKTHCAQSDAL